MDVRNNFLPRYIATKIRNKIVKTSKINKQTSPTYADIFKLKNKIYQSSYDYI